MSYLSTTEKAQIAAQIAAKQAQLDAANTAYLAALSHSEVETYSFDSGEGKQMTKRRSPEELSREISLIESQINRLTNRLYGRGLINMNLRRHSR